MQFSERNGQILGMHNLVRRLLVAHLPAHGRRGGRGDEEQLVGLGEGQVLVAGVERGIEAEVDAHAAAHDGLAVDFLADLDGGGDVEEGDDDALEGFEGCPGVHGAVAVDGLADLDEVGGLEDVGLDEVCDYESVGRRRGLYQWWEVGQVDG